MKKVAPEIDQLMWLIAEEGDSQAAREFEERYPDLRLELSRRIAMVRGLRGERPAKSKAASRIPAFSPRQAPEPAPRRLVWTASVLGVAALAAAFFTAGRFMQPNLPAVPPREPTVQAPRPSGEPVPSPRSGPSVAQTSPPRDFQPPAAAPPPSYLQLRSVSVKEAPLSAAIMMIAASGGLKVELAPGMPEPTVTIDYRQMTPVAMLRDLGERYGFTPFEQEEGSVLVIPAVDTRGLAPLPGETPNP